MNRKLSLGCVAIASAILLLNIIFSAQTVQAQTDTVADAGLYNDISVYLQSCVENAHIPAMSVTIVDQDNVLFSQSYGNCENCDTPFVLGSVSKSFTAVCIMQLVQQGKIDLNANIATYLPDAVDGDRITVNQLLNHTSGLGEHQTLQNYKIVNAQGFHTYANVNYSLLGKIIEAVSGQTYSDFITENLFRPLQLAHTAATRGESEKNGLIEGHTNYWGFNVKRNHQYPSSKNAWITVPAGYISASTNDLGKYLQMYLNGGKGILSEQSIETMFYGNAVYVVGQLHLRRWHLLEALIPRYFPWYIEKVPFNEEEIALLKTLTRNCADEYEKGILEFTKKFDFRTEMIRSRLTGFETRCDQEKLQYVRRQIRDVSESIGRLNEQFSQLYRQFDELNVKETGLTEKIMKGGGEENSELLDYFLLNKSLTLTEVTNSRISFVVTTTMSNFDPDAADLMLRNRHGYFYHTYGTGDEFDNPEMTEDRIERLLREIFETETMKLRLCAAF